MLASCRFESGHRHQIASGGNALRTLSRIGHFRSVTMVRIWIASLHQKAVPREGDGFFGADGPLQKRISAGLTRQASPLCRKYIYLCRDSFSISGPCDTSLNSSGLYGRHKKAPRKEKFRFKRSGAASAAPLRFFTGCAGGYRY